MVYYSLYNQHSYCYILKITILVHHHLEYQENQELNLLNHFVKIGNNIIGEIININENLITIKLLGEIINQEFSYGVLKKPSSKESVSLIDDNNLKIILNTLNYQEEKDLILGINPIYNQEVTIKINPFFQNHFAIFGSTGSGKSCGISRIIQNIYSKSLSKYKKLYH